MIDIVKGEKEYELLDSGDGEKLERYGSYVLRRPDPQALWPKILPEKEWSKADTSFVREGRDGKWLFKQGVNKEWNVSFGDLILKVSPTPFKHVGLFPEQLMNWKWAERIIRRAKAEGREVSVLNLFGYTGGASVSALHSGASVTHVDASRSAIGWGKENVALSGLADKPIRWILEDAYSFVKKELKRGKKYDGIIMDPPSFGRGVKGETWKIEKDFMPFVEDCKRLLSDDSLFFLVNGYAAGYSSLAYRQNVEDLKEKYGGNLEDGELGIEEKNSGRILPCGIFARWSKY